MTGVDEHISTGAYVLGALPEDEARGFERHLTACQVCAQEVREFTATATRLGLAVAQAPPPGLKAAVMRRAAVTRQEPPRAAARSPRRRRAAGMPRLALAASLALAAVLAGVAAWQHEEARDARARVDRAEERARLAQVLGAPDARFATGALGGGATGTIVVSRSMDRAAFIASGMPAPAAGTVYQLWFDRGGVMVPAGFMDPGAGESAVLLAGPVAGASGMGVTVEPAGGSPHPTTPPIAVMALPA